MGPRPRHFNGSHYSRHRVCHGTTIPEIAALIPIPFPARAGMEFLLRRRFHFVGRPAFIRGARTYAGHQRFDGRVGFGGWLFGERIGLRGHQLYLHCFAGRRVGVAADRDGTRVDA